MSIGKKMESLEEIKKIHRQETINRERIVLSDNTNLIHSFKELASKKGLKLTDDNFRYIETIGIVAIHPDILTFLNPTLKKDKEGLLDCCLLDSLFKKKHAGGFLYSDDYIIMAHPYFRREFRETANYAPRFIELFWEFDKPNIDSYISIDFDKVRINVDNSMYLEKDAWYGASFNKDIRKINDGVTKIRPPLDLDEFDISFIFNNAYSLDIKWETKNKIKTFQAEEFKTDKLKVNNKNLDCYPARYIHAEFDLEEGCFRHFDGAVHFYTEEEYYKRRESDLNYNSKNNLQIKSKSHKLFKMNCGINIKTWIEFTSHFFSGNPLVFEYFEDKYPKHITDILDKIRK